MTNSKKDEENFQFCIDSVLQNKMACDVFIHLMETMCTSNDQRKVLIQILINKLKNCKDRETELITQIKSINVTSKKVETSYASTQTALENETIEATTQTENDESNINPTKIEKSYASTQTVIENVESIEATTQTNDEEFIENSPIQEFIKDKEMFSPESSDVEHEHPDHLKETDVKIEQAEIFINEMFDVENLPMDQEDLNTVPSNVDKEFKCEKCSKTFHNKSILKRHSKLKHQNKIPKDVVKNQNTCNQNDSKSVSKKEYQFKCDICDCSMGIHG